MKKTLVAVLAVLACSSLILASCNKEDDGIAKAQTKAEMLTGIWYVTHYADDMNGNKSLDEDEKYLIEKDVEHMITFNPDFKGIISENIQGEEPNAIIFSWYLTNDDKDIVINRPDFKEEVITHIESLTASDFVLLDDEDASERFWIIMKKKQ